MVLSSSKRTSSVSSIANQNQGGGSKKAGFPYQAGRTMWSNVALGTINQGKTGRKCCTLANLSMAIKPACASRPVGRNFNGPYWKCPGV